MKKAFSLTIVCFAVLLIALSFEANVKTVNAAPGVGIISHGSYVDSIGYLHIVGEVQNTGTSVLTYVRITATYYDLNGTVIGTDFTYSHLDTLRVSEKSPFEILFIDKVQVAKVDHYSLTTSFSTGSPLIAALQILSNSSYIDSIGYMHIVGEIMNNGTSKATYVEVISTCYGSGGNVVLTDFTYSQPTDIEPGQKAPFEVLVIERDRIPLVASYILTAQSNQYSLIPEFPSSVFIFLVIVPILAGALLYRKRHLSI